MKNIYLSSFICVLLMFQNSPTQGQNKLNEEKLTEDSSVISGRLKNGFTYYIRPVRQHMPDIELQLLVNAGSYLQAKDQVGMAHFLEHLAFKASENFPAGLQNDVQKLNKLNISKFDLKGHSGTRATEYTFKAPRARQEAIDAGFMWFKDIANGKLQLNEHDIDKERGIYKQEYIIRGGDNFEKFQRENQLRHKLFSRTENMEDFFSHIDNFKPEVLRRFYQDWYLPNRIALMVVGNIKNPAALENKIKRIFSDIPSSVKRQKIPNIDSLFYERPSQFAVVEKKITNIHEPVEKLEFQLYYRDSITSKKLKTNAGRMRLLQWGFLFDILNNRFIEKEKGYNNNYKIRISHTFDDMTMPPSVKLEFHSSFDRYWDVLELAISSLKQLQEHGVSKREFEEIFKYRLKTNNKDFKQNSQFWFKQMNLHYLFGMPLTTEESVNNLLSSYTLEDFNSFVKENKLELPQDIGIISPKLEKPMDELEIRKGIRATYGKHTKPYTLTEGPEFLFSPSELKNFNNHPYTISKSAVKGVTEVKLKNGIKIILKNFQPNGINNDKIFIHGYTPNGALNFNPEHYFSAVNAPGFIKNSGVSKFDKYDLQQYLRGKNIFWHNINLYLHNLESGIKLYSSKKDFETMLQLINLFFTKAKVSKVAFQDWKQIEQNLYQHPIGDLKYLDLNVLGKNAINDHSGVTYGTARFKGLEKTDINQGFKMYNKVFGNIEEFTFLVSGNFNPEVLLPLLNKYLGSIPNSSDIPSKNPPKKNTLPSGPIFQEFSFPDAYNKNNIMYMPKYIKSKDTLDDWKERIRVEALGAVTNSKVWGLRFDKGYSLYITGTSGKENYEMDRYEINTSFDCVPDELPFIKKEFNIIINDLRKKLVSPDHLQQGLNRMKMLYNPKGRGNSQRAMQEKLYKHYRFGSKWISNGKILQFINSLTPKDILEAANKYYQKNNYYQFVLKSD